MQVRKFEAVDMHAAIAAIKDEMGPDAMILSTRQLQTGGLFSKPRVEVVAAPGETSDEPEAPMATAFQHARQTYTAAAASASAAARYSAPAASDDHPYLTWLGAADVARELAHDLTERAREHSDGSDRALIEALRDRLSRYTDGAPPLRGITALVGPTGVGKTTTLAKLAARAALVEDRRVVVLTLDTFRVGGVDQLRQYAELIRVPMEVCRDAASFTDAVRRHADADLILVDTAGRGPGDGEQVANLRNVFAGHGVTVLLTVAATTRCVECSALIRQFEDLGPAAVVLTKLDEAAALGAAVNMPHQLDRPLSFVTFGQRVPEDIAAPNAARLAELLLARARTIDSFASREVHPWN